MDPARYLLSWPINTFLAAAPADSGEPRAASSRHIWDVMTGTQNADQRGGHGKESEMAQRRRYLGPASGNRGASQHHYAKDEGPANRPAADEPAKEGPVAVPGRRRHEMTAYRIDGSGNLRVLHLHSLPSLGTIAT